MTTDTNAWAGVQQLLGDTFQVGDGCLYKENETGMRIEVTGSCTENKKRHFNIYVFQNGNEVGQSTAVPQDSLAKEIETICALFIF